MFIPEGYFDTVTAVLHASTVVANPAWADGAGVIAVSRNHSYVCLGTANNASRVRTAATER